MPFGPYKNFEDCVNKNQGKMRNVEAFCGWLKRKIEGRDPLVLFYLAEEDILRQLYRLDQLYTDWSELKSSLGKPSDPMQLLTREHAQGILAKPESIRKDSDAVVIDDHRWIHMWANAIRDKKELFLTKEQLSKLHQIYVDEFMRRGFNHQSPLQFEAIKLMGDNLKAILESREAFRLEPTFIYYVGSSISEKPQPRDVDVLWRTTKNPGYKESYLQSLPPQLREGQNFIWEPDGPCGPYIEGYEIWAIPKEDLVILEPKYTIQPLSPFPPAQPKRMVDREDIYELLEDSYYVIHANGIRLMAHRQNNEVIFYDRDLAEFEVPDLIYEDFLAMEEPPTFIIDGFLTSRDGAPLFLMIDMPWWRSSEHTKQTAEIRRHFLNKLKESKHVHQASGHYFSNRQDTIDFLRHEDGPCLLIPGSSGYPTDGQSAEWLLYESRTIELAAEGSDAQIRELVNSGRWENMSADERFRLMTKRQKIEPLYPFAQLKTTKKGYSAREVFGVKSVKDLAEELFRVPNKQATEVKIDGFRVQIHRDGDRVRLFTESGHEITQQLPTLVKDVKGLPAKSFALDSEATPYDEDLTNLGRAGAAPAFAKGAKGPVDDSLWALHVFDILYLDGDQLWNLPYQERRERLRGIELPVRDVPKSQADFKLHLWENSIEWAASAESMVRLAEKVSKVSGSEGAMFKQADSKYRLGGNTPLWSKMKSMYEIDAIVVGINREGGRYNYVGAIGPVKAEPDVTAPVDDPKGRKFVKWKGRVYSILGKTFNTDLKAEMGAIIRVTVKDVRKIDEQVYHWFHPKVLEVREDKTRPDPLKTAETISETATRQRKKAAYLVSARYELESPLACCLSPWIAVPGEEWSYLKHDESAYERLKELGIELLIGTKTERALAERWWDLGLDFSVEKAPTIASSLGELVYSDDPLPESVTINVDELKEFYDSIRSDDVPYMKLSCCATVPLEKPKYLADPYLTYPSETGVWKYVIQFHIRGLSVHADFRGQIDKNTLIGWTWSVGKSLLKPLLRRVSEGILSKVGLAKGQLESMTTGELSEKLRSSKEGRALMEKLSQKTQELSEAQLKALANELWKQEMEPILGDPASKILTQRKAPEPMEWLDYEGEVPAGAVGATKELEGQFVIMDKGTVEHGAQKSYFHEYWLKGDRIKSRRFIVRRLATRPKWEMKEAFAWMSFFTKPGAMPYTLSNRAVSQGWMPPKGVSALPKSVREQIPSQFQFWRAKNNKDIRDALIKAIKKKGISLKLAGLKFAVKRVWHKGPEVRRGRPVVRYWILLHDGQKVHDAWDFGQDSDPLEEEGITARRRAGRGFENLLKESGEIPATHPASYTKKLPNQFDTSDAGAVAVIADTDEMVRLRLNGKALKGLYVFVREDPRSEMWTFARSELPEPKKAMLLAGLSDGRVLHLSPADLKTERVGDLLFISGPAIKPGEVLPMDGKPAFFTKEGINKLWPSMLRQPIVVLHGELKGDVIGFVDKIHFDEKTGWGHVDRGVVWHPVGIKMILDGTLPAFSIEVLPESIWDSEHQHEHVIGGRCVGLAVVPVGACRTCTIQDAHFGSMKISPGQVYKFGMTPEQYFEQLYWEGRCSTQEISESEGIPRSTIESWMSAANIPRRSHLEARRLRGLKELEVRAFGGRATITALGTRAFTDIPRDDCPQCKEARAGGRSKRNYTATLFSVGSDHLLINTPKGINGMLGLVGAKPKHVLLEHIHEDVVGGLHELRSINPNVFATKEVWDYLKRHYRALSGEKGSFEEIYSFPRYVIKDQAFMLGKDGAPFTVAPFKVSHAKPGDPSALGFKIDIGGKTIWHCSDVLEVPNRTKILQDVDIYIGDGASLTRGVKTKSKGEEVGHASIEEQIKWAQDAGIKRIYFTQIGHVGKTHDELNQALKEMAPNAQALYDGAKISLGGKNPGAIHSGALAGRLANGERVVLVRKKPYAEFSSRAIYFGDENVIYGFYVEGYPEGPFSAAKVRFDLQKEHGFSDAEWEREFGDAETVWIYWPRVLKIFPEPRDYKSDERIGPYGYDVDVGQQRVS